MKIFLLAVLVCHVAATVVVVPGDDDVEWCAQAECSESQMCIMIQETQEVQCMGPKEAIEFVKAHNKQHGHGPRTPSTPVQKPKTHENHCTRSELMRMGGRLVKWFKDVHSANAGSDRTLKLHSVPCRAEIGWMFNQWDGDMDGKLSKTELRPLERGGNEPCVEEFIDMCDDMDVDGSISIDEWCDCFSFSDDLRHEPPCHKAKHGVDPHNVGVFLPRCDLEGFYKPEQCHDGHCWCVDRYGREFDQSRIQNTLPDCGQYASDLTEEDVAYLKARI
ncbi:hypothetical protein L3Y34_005648 [Caenorhabditis briggsae]|uniref:Thyroglobulin type-1 domain-containing protein n=1 Tax=Caenorhabditis briggsae TaxID=6238 RepID=A0AAE9IM53_CAEBR|nr:hypothetical protein L3Y34_005648 [Caenorhabditis briggsae]